MRARIRLATLLALLVSATLLAVPPVQPVRSTTSLGPAERIADGVELYRLDDSNLLSPPGPVAVQALRLDA